MNQTKKRLNIINLAISIMDIETIQLQVLKLGMIKTDDKIQNIISMLQAKNYAQAQGLIKTYIDTPIKDVLQRSSQVQKHIPTKEEQSTIDEFKLFTIPEGNEKNIEIDINDFINDNLQPTVFKPESKEKTANVNDIIEEIDINDFLSVAPVIQTQDEEINAFDSLLDIDPDDVLPDNIDLKINYTEEDNFFSLPPQESQREIHAGQILKDTFFDINDEKILDDKDQIPNEVNTVFTQNITVENIVKKPKEKPLEQVSLEESVLFTQEDTLQKENFIAEMPPAIAITEKVIPSHHKAIPYISQKLESMKKQYPSPHSSDQPFSALTDLLAKISQEKYSESEIEEILKSLKTLTKDKQFSLAVQLLLVCAATPSPFAQLMLARELYKGVLLTQNIPQAFILLNTLAMDDYAEALCDLGQFYENGIGTKKDKKRAEHLYKDAMELGIKRAKAHYERLKHSNKGFFR